MSWILILIVARCYSGCGVGIEHISFSNQVTCESARATVLQAIPHDNEPRYDGVTAICVPESR